MKHYDYIIIGSGIAGLYTGLLAQEYGSVLIITKGSIEDCNTRYAQGGIAAPISNLDSPQLHFNDTIAAGNGLCDTEAVRILSSEAAERIADLINFGVPFDTVHGEIALTMEAAHSVPRILHAGGDATGEHIELTLSERVRLSSIDVMEHCLATNIFVENGRVKSIETLDCNTGLQEHYSCRFAILATGGAGRLYRYTTNSEVATGDGNALAYRCGAVLTDMEFYQFHPTAIRLPGVQPFLISEAVRGEGGILRDVNTHRFMLDYASEAELAPRAVVSQSIVQQMIKTGSDRVFLDVTHISAKVIKTRFPNIYRFCLKHGLDITRDPIPVAPAAHYFMGGIKVNTSGETNIKGLFAAGETACTGVHGANRLASNSLLEVVVFSKRIVEHTREYREESPADTEAIDHLTLEERETVSTPSLNVPNLQNLMWEKVGIVRSGDTLAEAADILYSWQKKLPASSDRPSWELCNMLTNARLITESALIREESRGAHYRTDFPQSSSSWLKHIIFRSSQ